MSRDPHPKASKILPCRACRGRDAELKSSERAPERQGKNVTALNPVSHWGHSGSSGVQYFPPTLKVACIFPWFRLLVFFRFRSSRRILEFPTGAARAPCYTFLLPIIIRRRQAKSTTATSLGRLAKVGRIDLEVPKVLQDTSFRASTYIVHSRTSSLPQTPTSNPVSVTTSIPPIGDDVDNRGMCVDVDLPPQPTKKKKNPGRSRIHASPSPFTHVVRFPPQDPALPALPARLTLPPKLKSRPPMAPNPALRFLTP